MTQLVRIKFRPNLILFIFISCLYFTAQYLSILTIGFSMIQSYKDEKKIKNDTFELSFSNCCNLSNDEFLFDAYAFLSENQSNLNLSDKKNQFIWSSKNISHTVLNESVYESETKIQITEVNFCSNF